MQQATSLCGLLESAGAMPVRLPAIDIEPDGDLALLRRRLGPIDAFDLIIFTSANAVRFGVPLLERRQDLMLAAIGPATARALDAAGHAVTVVPQGGFDSESLLRHPRLEGALARHVLLVKGLHGRELLEEQLTRRGAQVAVATVYRRQRTPYEAAELAALEARFSAGEIQVITATSVEIADSLLDLATPHLKRRFDAVHWLVPGARIAAALRARGVAGPIVQAATAEDQDLVAALVAWRSTVSGA